MPELVLQVQDIDDRGKDYDFELTTGWIEDALADTALRPDPAKGPGRVHVHAQRNGREILVTGELDAGLVTPCARCLGDACLPVHTSVTALLVPGSASDLAQQPELSDEDLDRSYYEGHEIVLDELVREHLLLEVPMQHLCAPDCKGIEIPARVRPPADLFGDGTTDPRLRPLQQLRAKLSGDKE